MQAKANAPPVGVTFDTALSRAEHVLALATLYKLQAARELRTASLSVSRIIVGNGGGFVKTGRHVVYRRETPMCNMFLSMMDRMGAPQQHFGDSTGHLDQLSA